MDEVSGLGKKYQDEVIDGGMKLVSGGLRMMMHW